MALAPGPIDEGTRAAPLWVRAIDGLGLVCAVAAAVLLTAAVLVVTFMVVHRSLGASAFWEIELAVYLMVAAIFLASPYTLRTKGHVNVDLLDVLLGGQARRAVAYGTAAVGCFVCLYLAWHGWKLFHEAWVTGETSESMWKPVRWPLYLAMPVGLALTALQYAAELWKIGARGGS
ncbi:MAG: TRAP transporter small permease [Elioraea sp.]|nr:TRAP transporter small permease [Elioraea sp.]